MKRKICNPRKNGYIYKGKRETVIQPKVREIDGMNEICVRLWRELCFVLTTELSILCVPLLPLFLLFSFFSWIPGEGPGRT